MKINLSLVLVVCVSLLSGCVTQPVTTIDTTLNFRSPTEGTAGIYFYHYDELEVLPVLFNVGVGTYGDNDIVVDGKKLTDLPQWHYFYLELPGGKHTVQIGTYPVGGPDSKEFMFESGKNYFFKGIMANPAEYVLPITADEEILKVQEKILNVLKPVSGA